MNTGAFILALIALIGVTVFLYFNYPKGWRRSIIFNIIVLSFHIVGSFSLLAIFVFYKSIPFEWLKWSVSRWGSFYYVVVIYLGILFTTRLVVKRIFIFIHRVRRVPYSSEELSVMMDKRVHAIIFIIISFAIAIYGFINIGIVHTTKYDIHVDKPCARDELSIVFLADTHCGAGTWKNEYAGLIDKINAEHPDVIFLGGDIFDETTSGKDEQYFADLLKNVNPEMGIYYIYGNHDDSRNDYTGSWMREHGVTVLSDEMIILGDDIQVVGRLDPVVNPMNLKNLMNKVDEDESRPLLMLTHRPEEFDDISEYGFDVAMSGHTHGFNIPQFMGRNLAYDMYYGIKDYNGMSAITTSGVSAWGFHYKFPAKSEIVSIHLTFD